MQDSLKYLTENYCKTHHSDKTNSEVSVIDTQYRVLERISTRKIPSLYHSCTEAFKLTAMRQTRELIQPELKEQF